MGVKKVWHAKFPMLATQMGDSCKTMRNKIQHGLYYLPKWHFMGDWQNILCYECLRSTQERNQKYILVGQVNWVGSQFLNNNESKYPLYKMLSHNCGINDVGMYFFLYTNNKFSKILPHESPRFRNTEEKFIATYLLLLIMQLDIKYHWSNLLFLAHMII